MNARQKKKKIKMQIAKCTPNDICFITINPNEIDISTASDLLRAYVSMFPYQNFGILFDGMVVGTFDKATLVKYKENIEELINGYGQ